MMNNYVLADLSDFTVAGDNFFYKKMNQENRTHFNFYLKLKKTFNTGNDSSFMISYTFWYI